MILHYPSSFQLCEIIDWIILKRIFEGIGSPTFFFKLTIIKVVDFFFSVKFVMGVFNDGKESVSHFIVAALNHTIHWWLREGKSQFQWRIWDYTLPPKKLYGFWLWLCIVLLPQSFWILRPGLPCPCSLLSPFVIAPLIPIHLLL